MKKLKRKIKKSHIILFAILIFFLFPIRASWLLNLDSDKPLELFSMNWDYDSSSHTYQNYVVVDDPAERAELKQNISGHSKWFVDYSAIWDPTFVSSLWRWRYISRSNRRILGSNDKYA